MIVILAAVVLNLAIAYSYIATHSFSARERPSRLETFVARRLRGLATSPGTRRLKNPLEPTVLAIAEGRDHFADHCALCHGNTGDGDTTINKGLYPPAPDLRADDTQRLADGEILYIIKNGIRFTGMPGWGGTDEENWKLVLFIRHLPALSPEELKLMQEVNGADKEHHEGSH